MNYPAHYIDVLACALAERRATVEVELIGCVLSDPARGIAFAEQAGVELKSFEQDDLSAIFGVIQRARDRPMADILWEARCRLHDLGFWDESETRRFTRGMRWGDRSLVALACSFPGPAATTSYARKLRKLIARQRQARALYRRMVGLLEGTIEPFWRPVRNAAIRQSPATRDEEGEVYAIRN
jgi:hypothetical protein